ncbi:MAG TPA: AcvB/VirJ family lysyl-phosphatidylglycerol hydrolase, partial [Acidobacteriota bacterium]|nr:AcvB/VirJ family lysyl-phosphatidylglycerol hydrolase [Acidobacteriota bacterium]
THQATLGDRDWICPASDLVRGAINLEKTYGMKKYVPPVLVGYHEGSAMTYLALSENSDEFPGGFSFGFCPDISQYRRPCKETDMGYKRLKDSSGMTLFPDPALDNPFVVIGTERIPKCSVASVGDFIKQMPSASILPAEKDWMPQFLAAVDLMKKHALAAPAVVPDMTLIEYPSQEKDTMAIILSGDGGWVDLGRDLGDYLVSKKYAVVGFDTLQYYWNQRDPDSSANDMNRVIHGYLSAWKKQRVLLIGYSYGADVLPFMLRKMPAETRKRVAGVALIGPATKTQFEFNVSELERNPGPLTGQPLQPELKHLKDTSVLCIGGFNERESLCRHIRNSKLKIPNLEIKMLETGHGFGNNPGSLADYILQKFIH